MVIVIARGEYTIHVDSPLFCCLLIFCRNGVKEIPYLLTKLEDFAHGDIIRVTSHERNCGIDQTVFTALVVESKEDRLIAIPQDFEAYLFRQALNGVGWETSM